MLTQFPGYAFIMPLYVLLHLHCSRTTLSDPQFFTKEVRLRDVVFLRTYVPSMVLGYLIPTILMILPFSWFVHQWIAALWQGFPLWVFTLQCIFTFACRLPLRSGSTSTSVATKTYSEGNNVIVESPFLGDSSSELKTLSQVYRFAIGVSALTHLATTGFLLSRILNSKFKVECLRRTAQFRAGLCPASILFRQSHK